MTTKSIFLRNPYTDVIKVNALTDSVFRLDINNSIVYTRAEFIAKILASPEIDVNEESRAKYVRWLSSRLNNQKDLYSGYINPRNPFCLENSHSDLLCGGIAMIVFQLFKEANIDSGVHIIAGFTHYINSLDDGYFDQINKIEIYKDANVPANTEEIYNDKYLMLEPLRTFYLGWHYTAGSWTNYVQKPYEEINSCGKIDIPGGYQGTDNIYQPTLHTALSIDNIYMRMPGGSSLVLVTKSPTTPKMVTGDDLYEWATATITIPTGITGTVEMPFHMLNVTGTGSIIIDGVSYNLPTDEADVITALQLTNYDEEKWLRGFQVVANTGGLKAEFLVNRQRVLLFRNNTITYEMTSGSISFERVKADSAVPTIIVSIDKGENGSWTMDFNNQFTKNKSFRFPKPYLSWDHRMVYFLPNEDGKYSPSQYFTNYDVNTLSYIKSAAVKTGICWSAKLMPRQNTFTGTLELSFTIVDGSDVYYTTNGDTPTAASTKYTAPFIISATTTIKWINIKDDYSDSHVNTRVITKTA